MKHGFKIFFVSALFFGSLSVWSSEAEKKYFDTGSFLVEVPLDRDAFQRLVRDHEKNFVASGSLGKYAVIRSANSKGSVVAKKAVPISVGFSADNSPNDEDGPDQASVILYGPSSPKPQPIWAAVYDQNLCAREADHSQVLCVHFFSNAKGWEKKVPDEISNYLDWLLKRTSMKRYRVIYH